MTDDDVQAAIGQADTLAHGSRTESTAGQTDGIEDALLRRDLKARMFGRQDAVTIGRYEVLRRIGRGGMGVVYAAVDRELERNVAIKLLLAGRPAGRERMLREARALARLAHPNVVTVHEVGTHDNQVYVAMEFIEGPTLRQWLEQPHSRAELFDVFMQAARGLHAAHCAGLVHRDFKPDNVIVGNDGRVRVLDFGLAKAAEHEELAPESDSASPPDSMNAALTRTGQLLGTPAYMSPEQILGREVDARTDIFAVCVALFEALAGARPFAGDDVIAVHAAVQAGAPSLRDKVPSVPPDVLGELLERSVALELGAERARELHLLFDGWPGAARAITSIENCPEDIDRYEKR
jgi:serine/threonine protein kinase